MSIEDANAAAAATNYGAGVPLAPGSLKKPGSSKPAGVQRAQGPTAPRQIGKPTVQTPQPVNRVSTSPAVSVPPVPAISVPKPPVAAKVKLTFEISQMVQWIIECQDVCLSEDGQTLILGFPANETVPLRIMDLSRLPTVCVAAEDGVSFTLAFNEKPKAFSFGDKILYLLPLLPSEVEDEQPVMDNVPDADGAEFTAPPAVEQASLNSAIDDVLSRFGQTNPGA